MQRTVTLRHMMLWVFPIHLLAPSIAFQYDRFVLAVFLAAMVFAIFSGYSSIFAAMSAKASHRCEVTPNVAETTVLR
jgi:hypothetical protein